MHSRLFLAFIAFLAFFAVTLPAAAQHPRDGIANKKIDQAINDRYVATDFDGAEEALESVIKACGEKCSPAVLARAHMYIGIVRGAGRNDLKGAQKAFETALATDPNVELDDGLATPEVKKAFAAAQGKKGGKKPDAKPAEPAEKPAEKPIEKPAEKPAEPPPPAEEEEEKPEPKPAKAAEEKPEAKEPEEVKPPEPPPKPEGSCVHDGECDEGEACVNEMCTLVPVCKVDADCGASKCVDGQCKMRHFVGLHVAQDLAFGSVKACGFESEYGCYLAGTEDFYEGVPFDGGVDTPGFGVATTRILLSYELAIMPNISVGARAGLALGGGPPAADGTSFMPIHFEVRGAYYFGANVFDKAFRPYAYAGGGLAQVDVKTSTSVKECVNSSAPLECYEGGGSLLQSEINGLPSVNVDVYRKLGQGFIAVGGGVAYALSPSLLAQANLALMLMVPSSGFVMEPSLGLVLAL